jgi:hypothetical protein
MKILNYAITAFVHDRMTPKFWIKMGRGQNLYAVLELIGKMRDREIPKDIAKKLHFEVSDEARDWLETFVLESINEISAELLHMKINK